jgi:hypothetical protein
VVLEKELELRLGELTALAAMASETESVPPLVPAMEPPSHLEAMVSAYPWALQRKSLELALVHTRSDRNARAKQAMASYPP